MALESSEDYLARANSEVDKLVSATIYLAFAEKSFLEKVLANPQAALELVSARISDFDGMLGAHEKRFPRAFEIADLHFQASNRQIQMPELPPDE